MEVNLSEMLKEIENRNKQVRAFLKPSRFWLEQNGNSLEEKVNSYVDGILIEKSHIPLWLKTDDLFLINLLKPRAGFVAFPSQEREPELIANREVGVHFKEPVSTVFCIEELPPLFGIFTTQEALWILKEKDDEKAYQLLKKLVEKKFGIKVHVPSLTMKDYKGAENLKRYLKEIMSTLDDEELRPKGIMLIGIPGTGKSRSAKCVAGEMGRLLIEFNLSYIMQSDNPVEKLHSFFKVLEYFPPSILWIDEVEKAFAEGRVEEQIKGQLLTIIEEFNTSEGYRGDTIFWVTANDVSRIADRNPEFFRRFDYLFFIDLPKEEDAKEIISYYLDKYGVLPDESLTESKGMGNPVEAVFELIKEELIEDITGGLFPYTPAEINTFIKKLARMVKGRGDRAFSLEDARAVLKKQPPIIKAFEKAIDKMREQKKIFVEV